VAIIQQGTTPAQRVLVSSLKAMPALAEQANLRPPTLVIVGEVVQLHTKLAWFRSDGQVASVFGENH
jgi:uroporphyrin-III C-methyltransferase/precorrin-2 dehydrogenase/sirohydrochlorin ferrochelatase